MATQTTHSASSPTRETGSGARASGQLWQVPAFMLGVAALAGVWALRPLWHDPAARQLRQDLAAIRKALDPKDPNTSLALALGEDLLDQVDRFPDQAGEIHFLLGTAYLRRASEVAKEQAGYVRDKARHHLEEASALGVPEADRPRLMYRLARVWFLSGVDPQRVIDTLAQAGEAAMDDPNEGLGMLTQAFLRLPQPNVAAALEANARQLALPTEDEEVVEPARFLRGELLLRLNRRDEARKVLARIRRTAPDGLYAKARRLRAESSQQDGLWQEAAPLWEEMLKEAPEEAPEAGRVLYYLGVCYRRLERTRDAARVWEQALKEDAASSQAAALGLAELQLLGPKPGSALEYYNRALDKVTGPSDFHNPLLDLAEVRRQVEYGSRLYAKAGDFERAHRVAQLLEQLAPSANGLLAAQIAESWAQDSLKRAGSRTGSCAARLREQAQVHFREAAVAYEALAAAAPGKPEQAPLLWQGITCYLQAQSFPETAALLKRYLKTETVPERLGNGWYTLAEVYRTLADEPGARAAYLKCIEHPGAPAFRARYRLAQLDIEKARAQNDPKKLDDAEKGLEQNLELMRVSPDEDAYEQTLLTLAGLLMERENYRLAAVRLQEALDRYPGNPRQMMTRLQLADCYRRLAAQEEQFGLANHPLKEEARLHHREQRRFWLERATAHYQKLADDLTAKGAAHPLPEAEEAVLRQALSAVAESHWEQGQYAEAVLAYERIVSRYAHRPDALRALQWITRCHWAARDRQKALETIQRVRGFLQEVADVPDRAEWERWLDWAARTTQEMAAANGPVKAQAPPAPR